MNIFSFAREKYIAVFLKKTNSIYAKTKTVKIKITDKTISYDKKTFPIDFSKIAYRNGLKNFLMFDYDTGIQKSFAETDTASQQINELMDMILSKNIISQLVSRLGVKSGDLKPLTMILLIIIGIVVGYFIGSAYPIDEFIKAIQNIKIG